MHEGLPHIPLEKTFEVCYASACRMGEVMLGLWSVIVAGVVLPMCCRRLHEAMLLEAAASKHMCAIHVPGIEPETFSMLG